MQTIIKGSSGKRKMSFEAHMMSRRTVYFGGIMKDDIFLMAEGM